MRRLRLTHSDATKQGLAASYLECAGRCRSSIEHREAQNASKNRQSSRLSVSCPGAVSGSGAVGSEAEGAGKGTKKSDKEGSNGMARCGQRGGGRKKREKQRAGLKVEGGGRARAVEIRELELELR